MLLEFNKREKIKEIRGKTDFKKLFKVNEEEINN